MLTMYTSCGVVGQPGSDNRRGEAGGSRRRQGWRRHLLLRVLLHVLFVRHASARKQLDGCQRRSFTPMPQVHPQVHPQAVSSASILGRITSEYPESHEIMNMR